MHGVGEGDWQTRKDQKGERKEAEDEGEGRRRD